MFSPVEVFDAIRTSTEKKTFFDIWINQTTEEYDILYSMITKFIDIFEAYQNCCKHFGEHLSNSSRILSKLYSRIKYTLIKINFPKDYYLD